MSEWFRENTDGVKDDAVSLLERRLNTELRLPEWNRPCCSGECIPAWAGGPVVDEDPETGAWVEAMDPVAGESIEGCRDRGNASLLWNENMAWFQERTREERPSCKQ